MDIYTSKEDVNIMGNVMFFVFFAILFLFLDLYESLKMRFLRNRVPITSYLPCVYDVNGRPLHRKRVAITYEMVRLSAVL